MNLHLPTTPSVKGIQMEDIYLKERESELNNDLMEAVTKLPYHHQLQQCILINCAAVFES